MKNRIKAGVIGGAGYTGGELIRILLNHPNADLHFVQSKSHSGQPVEKVHSDLVGEGVGSFTEQVIEGSDVIFLCTGHGASAEFLSKNKFDDQIHIIDLSQDFRIKENGNEFIYGLPELNKELIKNSTKIANPGCFATCITLGMLPLAQAGLLNEPVHITGITGSTGAGQSLSPTSHFSWRNNNLSVYKAFDHQHLHEIRQSLNDLQPGFGADLNFIPVRGDFSRGIMVTSTVKCSLDENKIEKLFLDYYQEHPFVHVVKENPHLKQVVNSNKALIYLKKNNNYLLIVSMIDNLLKGASGQAVQNMNLMFGFEETAGLKFKATAF